MSHWAKRGSKFEKSAAALSNQLFCDLKFVGLRDTLFPCL